MDWLQLTELTRRGAGQRRRWLVRQSDNNELSVRCTLAGYELFRGEGHAAFIGESELTTESHPHASDGTQAGPRPRVMARPLKPSFLDNPVRAQGCGGHFAEPFLSEHLDRVASLE